MLMTFLFKYTRSTLLYSGHVYLIKNGFGNFGRHLRWEPVDLGSRSFMTLKSSKQKCEEKAKVVFARRAEQREEPVLCHPAVLPVAALQPPGGGASGRHPGNYCGLLV